MVLSAARAAGLTVVIQQGKLSVRGSGERPPQLIEEIRQHRDELVSVLEAEAAKKAKEEAEVLQYGWRVHPAHVPLPDAMSQFSPDEREALVAPVMGEGKQAIGWCLARGNMYFEKFPASSFEDQDAAAATDYLASCLGAIQ